MVTAPALWKWAAAYPKKNNGQLPTLREATKKFRCTLDDVENVIGDDLDDGQNYLGIGTAFGVSGGGTAAIEARGAYVVEAY